MKKNILFLLTLISLFCLSFFKVEAYSKIENIDIQVNLTEDGIAHVREVWTGVFDRGTEVYKQMNRMKQATISNFKVEENGVTYEALSYWDINKSRLEKKGKSGIKQDGDSYELCFGIGDYGQHTYVLNYDINNFVMQYNDHQGFNYQFIGESMNPKPNKISFVFETNKQLSVENAEIYAFGFDGDIIFEDGKIKSKSTNRVNKANYLVVFKGDFSYPTTNIINQDSSAVIKDAKRGSDYSDQNAFSLLITKFLKMLASVFVVFLVALVFLKSFILKKVTFTDGNNKKIKIKDVDYYRDLPVNGDLEYFYFVADRYDLVEGDESSILTAYLLKWIKEGQVTFVKEPGGWFKSGKIYNDGDVVIDLTNLNKFSSPFEKKASEIFFDAAYGDKVIEKDEFKTWLEIESNCDRISNLSKELISEMKLYAKSSGKMEGRKYTPFFREDIKQVLGFKKFLKEFTLINEKQVIEVALWENYLIFASILGLADEVEKQIKIQCPDFEKQSNFGRDYTIHNSMLFVNNSYSGALAQHTRSSGGGGFSSFGGGGGGFSGGGGGGIR